MNQPVKTLIFDLDGTIYQNTIFHRAYLRFLVEDSKWQAWETPLIDFSEEVFAGKKLKMNEFYVVEEAKPKTPAELITILEQRLQPKITYREALRCTDLLYLGDAWALMALIGGTLGLIQDGRGDVIYQKTRGQMEKQGMAGHPAFRQVIQDLLPHYHVILMSNSYEATALEFLRQLGYDGLFPSIISSANKPYDFITKLQELDPAILDYPETVLSIGDHAFNDLMPLTERGGYTVWLNPFEHVNRPACNLELGTVDDLTRFLRILAENAQTAASTEWRKQNESK